MNECGLFIMLSIFLSVIFLVLSLSFLEKTRKENKETVERIKKGLEPLEYPPFLGKNIYTFFLIVFFIILFILYYLYHF